jgi:hypothetical protein
MNRKKLADEMSKTLFMIEPKLAIVYLSMERDKPFFGITWDEVVLDDETDGVVGGCRFATTPEEDAEERLSELVDQWIADPFDMHCKLEVEHSGMCLCLEMISSNYKTIKADGAILLFERDGDAATAMLEAKKTLKQMVASMIEASKEEPANCGSAN